MILGKAGVKKTLRHQKDTEVMKSQGCVRKTWSSESVKLESFLRVHGKIFGEQMLWFLFRD